jgi:hypothetical protein
MVDCPVLQLVFISNISAVIGIVGCSLLEIMSRVQFELLTLCAVSFVAVEVCMELVLWRL